MDLESLVEEYNVLSDEIDALAITVERILEKKYAIEQILDHYSGQENDNL